MPAAGLHQGPVVQAPCPALPHRLPVLPLRGARGARGKERVRRQAAVSPSPPKRRSPPPPPPSRTHTPSWRLFRAAAPTWWASPASCVTAQGRGATALQQRVACRQVSRQQHRQVPRQLLPPARRSLEAQGLLNGGQLLQGHVEQQEPACGGQARGGRVGSGCRRCRRGAAAAAAACGDLDGGPDPGRLWGCRHRAR